MKKKNKASDSSLKNGTRKSALVVENDVYYFTKDQYEIKLNEMYDFLSNYHFFDFLKTVATFVFSYGATQLLNWLNESRNNEMGSLAEAWFENRIYMVFVFLGIIIWTVCFIVLKKRRSLINFKNQFLKEKNNQRLKMKSNYNLSSDPIS